MVVDYFRLLRCLEFEREKKDVGDEKNTKVCLQ